VLEPISKKTMEHWNGEDIVLLETFLQGYRDTVVPLMCGLQGLKIPTIAAINGIAVGMGCDLTSPAISG
jgi:2-(1,2-epoxy-1,2-dihydrophenyl)acetyl-CoA isomerase